MKRKKSSTRARPPPDDACPRCGRTMRETVGPHFVPVNGEEVRVSSPHLLCVCGEKVFRSGEVDAAHQKAFSSYRRRHSLLEADEIRALRERLDMTQRELARLLRLGENSISRWESGRNVQSASMDVLLRHLTVPSAVEFLRERT